MPKISLIADDKKEIFKNRLRQARIDKDLSKRGLLALLPPRGSVSESTYCKYEKGKTTPADMDILQAIADVLSVDVDYLRGISDNPNLKEFRAFVDSNEFSNSKNSKEVLRVRHFIAYANTFINVGLNTSIELFEVYETEFANFFIKFDEKDCLGGLRITMNTRGNVIDEFFESNPEMGHDKIDEVLKHPIVSPTGRNNIIERTHEFDTGDVDNEIFLEYLKSSKYIRHYIEAQSVVNTNKDRKYHLYRLSFEDFMKQLNSIFEITSEMFMLANETNKIRRGGSLWQKAKDTTEDLELGSSQKGRIR